MTNTVKRYRGRIKWFSNTKGFGFIIPDEPVGGVPPNTDVFVHATAMQSVAESLRETKEASVTFIVGTHNGKPNAQDVLLA
jgi:CspA family cold shock protein